MTVDDVLVRAARYGIGVGEQIDASELDIAAVLHGATRHRIVGLLAASIADGEIHVTDAAREHVADAHEHWGEHVLRVERLLLDLIELLDDSGIEYRAVKGASLAHTVYADPSHRLYADADLLVSGDDLDEAVRLAVDELGASTLLPPIRPGFDREFGKSTTVHRDRNEIDLHRTLAAGPLGMMIPVDQLFAAADSFRLGDRLVACLPPAEQFVHACLNAAVGDRPPRLIAQRDVWDTSRSAGDVGAVAEVARRWRCTAAVKLAVTETWATLRLPVNDLHEWALSTRPPMLERAMLRSYLTPARSYSRPLATALVVPGTRNKLRYLSAVVRPQDSYLAARGWTRGAHVRRALWRLTRFR